jgi:FMN phosphatase YigB (HAD superfamily)
MINTLLIDLDDTLLRNDMAVFIPAYLERLGAHLTPLDPPENLVREVLRGTDAMLSNLDPRVTLEDTFWSTFLAGVEGERETFQPVFEDFYAVAFPELKHLTEPMPHATELVNEALSLGMEIVIATNPLFPRSAIDHRLRWTGFSVSQSPFTMVTSIENSHFAKPQLSYYAEILAKLGRPMREALMIGNDPEDDLRPAAALGIGCYHVRDEPEEGFSGGSLQEAVRWLDEMVSRPDHLPLLDPNVALARMRAALSAVLDMTRSVTPEQWSSRPEEHGWAPVEIMCHLRDVDLEVNRPRLERILAENEAFISAVSPDQWAEEREYLAQSGPDAVCSLSKSRMDLIQILETLDDAQWSKIARHALLGPTNLVEIMSVAADHDLLHLAQLRQILAGHRAKKMLPHAS